MREKKILEFLSYSKNSLLNNGGEIFKTIFFLPPAQDPEEVPPLLLHSALVKQVPFL